MDRWGESPRSSSYSSTDKKINLVKQKKYPKLSQILTPFCPRIKGSIRTVHFAPDQMFINF